MKSTRNTLPTLAVAIALASAAATGCGTTTIMTNEPSARIFADGQMLGKGQAELTQRGTPGSTTVIVKTDDGRHAQQVISRKFTGFTFLTGLFTYGICFFACWEYPGSVMVPLAPAPAHDPSLGPAPAGEGAVDPWLQPPQGWKPKEPVAGPSAS